MDMESTRRPFNRSIGKEPGLKKPRLAEEPAAPNRSSNGRGGFARGTAGPRRELGNSDSTRGGGIQQHQQAYQELVDQYKTALAELTFNSKPIITNLTIIAGENLQAAKAIAATVCTNILEVPSEQKLPSLYLLDSIVKNIGRDYIKYFATRLPEVFCKAYKQVDPAVHSGMRHLFGTWKGVFPSQTLQMIAEELEFSTNVNGSSSVTSRQDSHVQRPAHSIHVNPKYLEARQRLQTTRDAEATEGPSSTSSGRSWSDSYAKPIQHNERDQLPEYVRDKSSHSEFGSSASGRPGVSTGVLNDKFKERGFDRTWYDSGNDLTGKISSQKNGFETKPESYAAFTTVNRNSSRQLKQSFTSRSTEEMNKSWQDSGEEEYMWDEMSSKPSSHSLTDPSAKDHWSSENYGRLDFRSHIRRPDSIHGIGSGLEDDTPTDIMSTKLGHLASGTGVPLAWSQELQPSEKRMLPTRNLSGYSEGYSSELKNSMNPIGKTLPLVPAHVGVPSSNFSRNVNSQVLIAPKVSTPSSVPQRPPSPSFPAHDLSHLLNSLTERNKTSAGPPTDPRKPLGLRHRVHNDQSSQDSASFPYQDDYEASTKKLQPQTLRNTRATMLPLQHRKHVSQQRKLDVSGFGSSVDEDNLLRSQVSISENVLRTETSLPEKSNIPVVDSPGQSITSSLLATVLKRGTLGGSNSIIPNSHEVGPVSSQKKSELLPLAGGSLPSSLALAADSQTNPTAVHSSADPFSSLLSSLISQGLISSSKSDSVSSASIQKTNQPPDRSPGVASTSSAPFSPVPKIISKACSSVKEVPSSVQAIAKASQDLLESSPKIKDLIGFDFKPNIIRNFHPAVVSDLTDLPHQCSICGLKLKLQERLDKHMEWHALKAHELEPPNTTSRRWYSNSVDWVAGFGELFPCQSPSSLLEESEETGDGEQMVPADESQCACILCGELFEDFYSRERNEWMFTGAVYLAASAEFKSIGVMNDTDNMRPIVHANCITEDSFQDLGLSSDAKLDEDA